MPKKAFVSGCFDMLHSGHVAFFEEAARYGDLYVAIGSDRNVFELKHRATINNEAERLYMIKSLACVKDVFVANGSGILDFVEELKEVRPDYFVVNEDGSTKAKRRLCEELGIEYIVLMREPHQGLKVRSTTALRGISLIPDSLTLAGGILDKPVFSRLAPGPALVVSIKPLTGTSSALRQSALELWEARLPAADPEKLAKTLFGYGNMPGSRTITGSKDAIGIAHPGLTRADYAGEYWPEKIQNIRDEETLGFIENWLHLIPLASQVMDPPATGDPFHALELARAQACASEACLESIQKKDPAGFGKALMEGLNTCDFESLRSEDRKNIIRLASKALGWNICELGARQWLMIISDDAPENSLPINIRRADDQ